MTYLKDKTNGENAENLVADILSCSWNVEHASTIHTGRFADWDIVALQSLESNGSNEVAQKSFTVEVKYDEMQSKTGNIAIEIYNPKSDKASGLSATKADLWCHVLKDSVWVTSTNKLKKFVKDNIPFKLHKTAGDGNATILLFKREHILKIFDRIDKCEKMALTKIIDSQLK